MVNPLLEIKGLHTYYYRKNRSAIRAVDGVNFEIGYGESLALVGESGCGKSTIAHTIMRLLPLNARIIKGHAIFEGSTDLTKVDEDSLRNIRFKKISIIFQASMNMLDPIMKLEDQIAELIKLHRKSVSKDEALQEARKLLEIVSIPAQKGKDYPHQLSGGQRQRVLIAMAIALKPKLIIADEPFTALDVMVQAQLIEQLNIIRKKIGNSLMLITHDIHVTGELCDKMAVMYAGKIVEYGSMKRIIESPAHPYTMGLLNSAPDITGLIEPKSIPGFPPDLSNPPSGCRFHPRCPNKSKLCEKEEPRLFKKGEDHYVMCFYS